YTDGPGVCEEHREDCSAWWIFCSKWQCESSC
ncbi:hypothetical protein A2U01_0118244, partial [Trifolium medium]|nr:hypothetical protein [Trifolium medium]